jgi:lipoprotein-anchoring transpeptidase ErfK/SrfK
MRLFSLALSVLVALPLTASFAQTSVENDKALDEFEILTEQMRNYQEAYDRGEVLTPLKVQQYDTDAKEVKPEEAFEDYKSAVTDRYYGYQLFFLVNKSVSNKSSKERDMKTLQPQTMYIFARKGDEIQLRGVLPVSTGKEPQPGKSDTHEGYMRIQSAQEKYTSRKYGEAMPFSLWFESEYGTAIHQTLQTRCDQLIGRRASAGCIRLCPGDAEKIFRVVTSPEYPRSSAIVLLDKKTGVPVPRGIAKSLSGTPKNAGYLAPKVIRGFPVMVRIIDGNTPEKVQEMQEILQNPSQGFQRYFKPIGAQVLQRLSI